MEDEVVPARPVPLPPPAGCPAAARYAAFAAARLGEAAGGPPAALRCLVRLTLQFHYERLGSEPEHRDRVFEANGERCLYGQFLAALERWHEVWLAVERLPVQDPPPPPPLPYHLLPQQVSGLFYDEE